MTEFVQNLSQYLHSAPLLAYLAVFVGGILTSFEPCIYTMLPITVAFIGSQAGGSKFKGFFSVNCVCDGIASHLFNTGGDSSPYRLPVR